MDEVKILTSILILLFLSELLPIVIMGKKEFERRLNEDDIFAGLLFWATLFTGMCLVAVLFTLLVCGSSPAACPGF